MWYLGSWYAPKDLADLTKPNPPSFISHTVISRGLHPGLVVALAQTHPDGYQRNAIRILDARSRAAGRLHRDASGKQTQADIRKYDHGR